MMIRRAVFASAISALLAACGKSDENPNKENNISSAPETGRIDKRLKELGIEIPEANTPIAAYTPIRKVGNMVYIAGQSSQMKGIVGTDYNSDEGKTAIREAALKALSQLKAACGGDLDRVVQCVQLQVLVRSTADFTDQHIVANGASELFRDIFGDAGLAARAAVGVNGFPNGAACNVIATFEIA